MNLDKLQELREAIKIIIDNETDEQCNGVSNVICKYLMEHESLNMVTIVKDIMSNHWDDFQHLYTGDNKKLNNLVKLTCIRERLFASGYFTEGPK